MLGMSPCLLNTFDQFLWPSSPRLALPAPGFTPVLLVSPIPTVSLGFNTVEASVWPLDPFALPFNTSPQLLWLLNPPAHVFMPPEHILLVLNTIEASGQWLFTYLCIDLDPRVNTHAEFCMGMGMGHVSNTCRLPRLLPNHLALAPRQEHGCTTKINRVCILCGWLGWHR